MWKQNFILATFTFLFISTIGIKAQSKSHVVTDIHYLYGLSETGTGLATLTRNDVNLYGKSLHFTGLYDFSKSISAGIGVGADRYEKPGYNTFPIFATLQYFPIITFPSAYAYTNLGTAIKGSDAHSGLMFDAGLGYRKMLKKHFGLNFQLGYNLKHINDTPNYILAEDNQSYERISVTSVRHSISLGVGVIF